MAKVKNDVYNGPQWYKRFFAWAMATAAADYEGAIATRKHTLFANLQGEVLEIGPGAGVNLRYLQPNTHWIGLEPNRYMHSYLRQEAEQLGLKDIDLRTETAGNAGISDSSINTVISTLVLCSVPDLAATLQEILRVLKPGGQFLFIEHVAAPTGTLLRQVQSGIRPFWQIIGDGCCPDRNIEKALAEAGFSDISHEAFEGPVPISIVKPHIIGTATK
ncbi:MAG: class I SAM-dependent methyltransferase [Cyanobacteria bacterium P01_A01_bin.17]